MRNSSNRKHLSRASGAGAALLLSLAIATAQARAEDFAITHVSVIPMDRERVIPDQTLLVHDGHILRYGPAASTLPPKGGKLIDGRGRYVIPGLSDMHVHIPVGGPTINGSAEGSVSPDAARAFLDLFIANGVTTVRNMAGGEPHLLLRDAINAGKVEGPRIFTASAIMDGDPPLTSYTMAFGKPDAARAYVRWSARKGFDFIKVYSTLGTDVFDAVVDEAGKQKLPITGHLPQLVSFDHALRGMRSIEHLSGFDVAFWPDPSKVSAGIPDLYTGFAFGTTAKIEELVAKVKKAGVWNDPTLVVYDRLTNELDREKRQGLPEGRYLPAELRDDTLFNQVFDARHRSNLEGSRSVRLAIVKALSDAGAPLLTGTDSPALVVVPGFSLHTELKHFVEAGLTPYQALAASTAEPARYLDRVGQFGTIVPGASADLVLLAANPLEDIDNADRIEGVMVRGRWYPRQEIDATLEAHAAKFAPPE
ncbi:amidohydrolase family protein [Rhizorhabdus wittichii]|uniref:Amidohydrolase family protein n=1 Tax=Rhizorhabdus wittichii TaxID=160791 RepID=A0A975HE59_9SPHN|nr:amidohydrolase family protein [Rhizorhabdus wittichii]QTH22126.1 amidohydrolase family protein [Rhizorhabdus wittichii]